MTDNLTGRTVDYYQYNGWAAVYADGELVDGPGDDYNRIEYMLAGFGVTTHIEDDFRVDETGKEIVAPTVDEIHRRRAHRQAAAVRAAQLREQAMKLVEEANRLDP